jgi:hypothetical protein
MKRTLGRIGGGFLVTGVTLVLLAAVALASGTQSWGPEQWSHTNWETISTAQYESDNVTGTHTVSIPFVSSSYCAENGQTKKFEIRIQEEQFGVDVTHGPKTFPCEAVSSQGYLNMPKNNDFHLDIRKKGGWGENDGLVWTASGRVSWP